MSLLAQIIQRLNDIQNNAKLIPELPMATMGQKTIAVFNEETQTTQQMPFEIPTIENGIVSLGSLVVSDGVATFNPTYSANFNGVLATANLQTFDIELSASGLQRFNIYVLNQFGLIVEIQGDDDEVAILPNVPENTFLIATILVTDEGTTTAPPPDLSGFIEKQFYAIKPITTETFTLTNDGSTTFLLDTPTFGGFNFSNANAVKLFQGKTFTLANFTDEPITLLDGFGGATIKFTNEIIIPAGISLRFFVQFVETIINDETIFVSYRLNLIGAVGGGGGGTTVHNDTTGRDAENAHPISAITGLEGELDNRLLKEDLEVTPTAGVINSTAEMSDRTVILNVGATATTFNINNALRNTTFKHIGTAVVTFVSGAGRTLRTPNSTNELDTFEIAYLDAVGTEDRLYINKNPEAYVLRRNQKNGSIQSTDFVLIGGVLVYEVEFATAYPDASYDVNINFKRISGSLFSLPFVTTDYTNEGFTLVLNTEIAPTGIVINWSTMRYE
jgi:hypothetical protein